MSLRIPMRMVVKVVAVWALLSGAGSVQAGEYADSIPALPPEYHYRAAALAAAVTLPALYVAYSNNSHLGLFLAATFPPMIGYATAGNRHFLFPLQRNACLAILTYAAYITYAVGIAAGISANGGGRTEKKEAEDNQTMSDILRYGFFAMGPLTLLDFVIIAIPQQPSRVAINLHPDRALLTYTF